MREYCQQCAPETAHAWKLMWALTAAAVLAAMQQPSLPHTHTHIHTHWALTVAAGVHDARAWRARPWVAQQQALVPAALFLARRVTATATVGSGCRVTLEGCPCGAGGQVLATQLATRVWGNPGVPARVHTQNETTFGDMYTTATQLTTCVWGNPGVPARACTHRMKQHLGLVH